jgi:uncharacterized protein YndB with AHSA1/START domain
VNPLGEITPCWSITFHRTSKHPPARLWAAITEPDYLVRWWNVPPVARVDLRVGGEYYVDFGGGEGLDGVIVRLEPERLLAYVWGMSVVEWRIEPEGSGSRYTFTDHGNRAPPTGADWRSEGVAGGYHQGLERLEAVLDGAGAGTADMGEWERMQAAYRPLIERIMGAAH